MKRKSCELIDLTITDDYYVKVSKTKDELKQRQVFAETFKANHYSNFLETKDTLSYLRDNLIWINRFGRRVAKGVFKDGQVLDAQVNNLVQDVIDRLHLKAHCNKVTQVYINYYKSGNNGCGRHRHPSTIQVILSFGATRTLRITDGDGITLVDFAMKNGDVAIFGSQYHEVIKEPGQVGERISIAIFLQPQPN